MVKIPHTDHINDAEIIQCAPQLHNSEAIKLILCNCHVLRFLPSHFSYSDVINFVRESQIVKQRLQLWKKKVPKKWLSQINKLWSIRFLHFTLFSITREMEIRLKHIFSFCSFTCRPIDLPQTNDWLCNYWQRNPDHSFDIAKFPAKYWNKTKSKKRKVNCGDLMSPIADGSKINFCVRRP